MVKGRKKTSRGKMVWVVRGEDEGKSNLSGWR